MTCVWTPDPACLGDDWNNYSPEVRERALHLATSSLLMLTNNRVGTCPETLRLCPEPLPCPSTAQKGHDWEPHYIVQDGAWLNACGCATARWCSPLSEVDLPGPIGYVDSIKVDGEELPLDTGDWRVDDGHLLVWQGEGPSPIPNTQDLNKPDTKPGTWSITYSRSYPVGTSGQIAVAYLAAEFAKACAKSNKKCSLPKGVTNVTRNGVSFSIEAGLFPGGLTGIEMADQFILQWAPAGSPTKRAEVFDPTNVRGSVRRSAGLLTRGGTP